MNASLCRKPFRNECVCWKVKGSSGCTDCPTCGVCSEDFKCGLNHSTKKCPYIEERYI